MIVFGFVNRKMVVWILVGCILHGDCFANVKTLKRFASNAEYKPLTAIGVIFAHFKSFQIKNHFHFA